MERQLACSLLAAFTNAAVKPLQVFLLTALLALHSQVLWELLSQV